MRWSRTFSALIAGAVGVGSLPARASETFVCVDTTTVHVTAQNRAEMNEHPCVKEWFEKSRDKAKAALEANTLDNATRVTVQRWRSNSFGTATVEPDDYVGSITLFSIRTYAPRWRGMCRGR